MRTTLTINKVARMWTKNDSHGPMRFLSAVVLPIMVVAPIYSQDENQSTADYTTFANVQYCTGGHKSLLMDVFVPGGRIQRPTPAVLWLHGGGWERGDKNGSSGARFLASAGFVTASIYYRLSGEAKFPADIEDCKCAIRYLRANARQYGIDPDRIGIAGASSGGHLALLVGTADQKAGLEGSGGWPHVSSRVKAVVSYYGPTDLRTITADFGARAQAAITKLIGATPQEDPGGYRRASPITYVSPGDPPILIVHGDSDTLVPFEQSKRMLDAYLRAGLTATLVKVENANHDFERRDPDKPLSISIEQIHAMTAEFFRKQLLSPASGSEKK
jgi:acetyl esterase/lipase